MMNARMLDGDMDSAVRHRHDPNRLFHTSMSVSNKQQAAAAYRISRRGHARCERHSLVPTEMRDQPRGRLGRMMREAGRLRMMQPASDEPNDTHLRAFQLAFTLSGDPTLVHSTWRLFMW